MLPFLPALPIPSGPPNLPSAVHMRYLEYIEVSSFCDASYFLKPISTEFYRYHNSISQCTKARSKIPRFLKCTQICTHLFMKIILVDYGFLFKFPVSELVFCVCN